MIPLLSQDANFWYGSFHLTKVTWKKERFGYNIGSVYKSILNRRQQHLRTFDFVIALNGIKVRSMA